MITSEKEYIKAMRKMILRVQSGNAPESRASSIEEMEILSDCIRAGYLIGAVERIDEKTGIKSELRTMDGKMHPELLNNIVTPKGLAFLRPEKTRLYSRVAIIVSLIAATISLFSLIVALLSNLDKIISNMELLLSLLGN